MTFCQIEKAARAAQNEVARANLAHLRDRYRYTLLMARGGGTTQRSEMEACWPPPHVWKWIWQRGSRSLFSRFRRRSHTAGDPRAQHILQEASSNFHKRRNDRIEARARQRTATFSWNKEQENEPEHRS